MIELIISELFLANLKYEMFAIMAEWLNSDLW